MHKFINNIDTTHYPKYNVFFGEKMIPKNHKLKWKTPQGPPGKDIILVEGGK